MKLIKKLINISLIMVLCFGCFGLVACNNSNNNNNDNNKTPLTLNQITLICDSILGDLGSLNNSETSAQSGDNLNTNQTSNIGINYSDYTSYIPSNAYDNLVALIDNIEKKYELFKSNMLDLSNNYEYKIIVDNDNEYYMYLRISSMTASQINIECANTKESMSATYNAEIEYQSVIINLDNNLQWTSVNVKHLTQSNYGSNDADVSYYNIQKSQYDNTKYIYTETNTDYRYININNVIAKSITLDCSHPLVLTKNQSKAKSYIDSLNLTSTNDILEMFTQPAEYRGMFYESDI